MNAEPRKFFLHPSRHPFDIGCDNSAGYCRNFPLSVIPALHRAAFSKLPQGIFKFLQQKPYHADTIFQLQIPIVVILVRNLLFRQDIPFVAGMDKMQTVLGKKLFLPFVDRRKHLLRVFFCKGLQRIQPLPVFRQSNRHNRHAAQMRQIFRHVGNTAFQLCTVVDSLT